MVFTNIYKQQLSYRAINTAISDVLSFLSLCGKESFESNNLDRSMLPTYNNVWDVIGVFENLVPIVKFILESFVM